MNVPQTDVGPSEGESAVTMRIRQWLREAGVEFRECVHEPTLTSEDSARARGEPLYVGAKALLLKCDANFGLFVLPADRKLDSQALRLALGFKKIRFATQEELWAATGLVAGSVPPFGYPILPFPLVADATVGQQIDRVAFNAGSLTHSIIMTATDWERVAQPRRCSFASP